MTQKKTLIQSKEDRRGGIEKKQDKQKTVNDRAQFNHINNHFACKLFKLPMKKLSNWIKFLFLKTQKSKMPPPAGHAA